MLVLLIAALAVAALLAGGIMIIRSRARELERRERLHKARLAASAAQSRAEEARRRAALEASDALTSVLPAIRLPWARQPQEAVPDDDSYVSFTDYPRFPAAVPFQAEEEPAWYRDERPGRYAAADHGASGQSEYAAGHPAERTAPGNWPDEPPRPSARPAEWTASAASPAERTASAASPAERGGPADRPHRRVGQSSHRGGHARRRRG